VVEITTFATKFNYRLIASPLSPQSVLFRILYYIQLVVVKALKIAATAILTIVLSFFVIVWNMRTQPINVTPYIYENQQKTGIKPQQQWIPLDSISPEVIKAVIACEDNNFFYHIGFDLDAIREAMERNQHSKKIYGASTITQQTVKNVFLSHQRTWLRKAAELGLSLLVEIMWGKARIMEVYLNVIEMGANIYGIEAAARHYFGKQALMLNRREAILIAISLPNPKKYNPLRSTKYMNARYEQAAETIDKLMKYGWYKDIKDVKRIKVNYLEHYPSLPRTIADADKKDTDTDIPNPTMKIISDTNDTSDDNDDNDGNDATDANEDSTAVANSATISESVLTH
jgi:monofunctional biosynthetic peptidoglycan transglycosylase